MLHSLFRAGLALGLFGLLLVPGTAWAQDRRVRHVQDDAHLFSKDAIAEANAVITKIHDKHHKDLFIETVKEGPEKAEQAKWSRDRFNEFKMDGVYVVFCTQPKFFRIEDGNKTRASGYFGAEDVKELTRIIKEKQTNDEMLKRVANFVLETMNQHAPQKKADAPVAQRAEPVLAQRGQGAPVAQRGDDQPSWLSAILPWVCIIVGGLVVVWIIFAIIRALTGMGGGGYGYGGGGMGGGGMGMGGGLLTGMLGGLFGSFAGMWLYNNMFGGHASYGADGGVNWGGSNQGGAGYGGDTDTGASGGGDDWGGGQGDGGADAGGKGGDDAADGGGKGGDGDAGGGGGDWGGGNDAGGGDAGGGDWGGGGDAGGGGGDWGGGGDAGGGGGDWGGGGGDFGGGGGGGDW